MKAFVHSLLGVVVGALLVTGGTFAATTWHGLPPLVQKQLNDRAGAEMAYGSASITCSTNGNFTITHGLSATPDVAFIEVEGDTTTRFDVQAVGATTITGRCASGVDGTDITTGSFTVSWLAKVAV